MSLIGMNLFCKKYALVRHLFAVK